MKSILRVAVPHRYPIPHPETNHNIPFANDEDGIAPAPTNTGLCYTASRHTTDLRYSARESLKTVVNPTYNLCLGNPSKKQRPVVTASPSSKQNCREIPVPKNYKDRLRFAADAYGLPRILSQRFCRHSWSAQADEVVPGYSYPPP